MSPTRKALFQIHFCVVLWGFTAILGKLIWLDALPLVWWRMSLVAAVLVLVPRVWRGIAMMTARLRLVYAGIGVIIALHWLTFYASIKLANASVAATCIAFGPVFLAVVEPALTRRPFDMRELLLGLAVIPGVALVAGGVPDGMRLGIVVGALSAFLVAIFGTLNKRFVEHGDPLAVTAIEITAGAILLTLLAPLLPHSGAAIPLPGARDAMLLLVLAIGCTILPFTLSLVALRHITAFGAQLAVNLEPVYAIAIASVFLGEHLELGPRFYAGVALIVGTVLTYPLIVRRPVMLQPEELSPTEPGKEESF